MNQRIFKYIVRPTLGILGLVLCILILLHTPWGLNLVAQSVLSRLQIFNDASLTVERVTGRPFSRLNLEEIRIVDKHDSTLVHVDHAEVGYNLLPMLRGSFQLHNLVVSSPKVTMKQDNNQSWDLVGIIPQSEDTTALDLSLTNFVLEDGVIEAQSFANGRDSTYTIKNLAVQLGALTINESISASLDKLQGNIWIPSATEPVTFGITAQYDDNRVSLDSLTLQSEQSNVQGHGNLILSIDDSLLYQNELTISATPLAFDDIRLFVPGLAAGQFANLNLDISSATNSLLTEANVRLSDGARINLQSRLGQDAQGRHVVEAEGIVRDFNPGLLTGTSSLNSIFNADLNADFSGEQFDQLSGSGNLSVFESELAGQQLDSTFVDAKLQDGRMDISMIGGIYAMDLSLEGYLTPFEDRPAYEFRGAISNLDVGTFTEGQQSSDINANVSVNGAGFSPADAVADVVVDVLPSSINLFTIDDGRLDANLSQGQLNHLFNVWGPNGRLSSAGSVQLGDQTALEEVTLVLTGLDIAALAGDTTQSALTGQTTVNGLLMPTDAADLRLSTTIDNISYAHIDAENLLFNGSWIGQEILIEGNGAIENGSFSLSGDVQIDADSITYEITKGQFDDINIGDLTADSSLSSDLNGSFFLVGNGFDPASMKLSGQVELDSSYYNQQQIEEASSWFALASDSLSLDLSVQMPEGVSSFKARATSISATPAYRISDGVFEQIDLGKITGNEGLSTNLNGTFSLKARGVSLDSLTAEGQLDLGISSFNEVPIQGGNTALDIAGGNAQINTQIQFEDGLATLNANASSLTAETAYSFSGNLSDVDIARLLGSDSTTSSINLSISGSGQGFEPGKMAFKSQVSSDSSTFADIKIDSLVMDLTLEQDMLLVDTLLLASNVASMSGHGPLALFEGESNTSSNLTINTQLLDLAPLQKFVPATSLDVTSGELETRVFGRQGILRSDTKIEIQGFVYDTYHVGEVDVRVTGELDESRSLNNADMTGQISAVSIPGFVFEEINIEAQYDSLEVRFATNGRLDRERGARVSGSYFTYPDSQLIRLDLVNLSLDEDIWDLVQPTSISLGETYRVDNFDVRSGDQRIALNGIIDLADRQDVLFEVENFRVGTVADLLGFTGLDGPVSGFVTLEGLADMPLIKGNLDMDLITFGEEAGDLNIDVAYDSLQLSLNATLDQQANKSARINGTLPVNLALTTPEESTSGTGLSQNIAMEGGIDFKIRSDSMNINWVLPFIDPSLLDVLEGALTAEMDITGTAQDPQLAGTGRLVEGRIRSPLLGVIYEDLESDVALNNNVITLTNTKLQSGEGFVSGNGSIELNDLTTAILDIDVTASEFLAINTREYRATASGTMDLTGNLTSPVLNGDITVLSADLFLNESTTSELVDLTVQLSGEDLLMLEREFGIRVSEADTTTFDFLDALTMDVDILFERDIWIRSKKNPEMNIQFSGELDVSKDPGGEYIAFGNIELIPDRSYINQFGKRFDITLGNLTFNGPATDPRLDFEALYEVPARRSQENAVTIYLDAEGQVEDLDLTLSADPTMELTDILSYIATGQPASEALQLGGSGQSLASTGAGFAINQGVGLLSGAIESLLQDSGLELDVIQIEPQANAKGATITAGKYVTPRIFTAVSQPIGAADSDGTSTREEGTIITLELELVDSLLLRLLGGESVLQINLLWHHAY